MLNHCWKQTSSTFQNNFKRIEKNHVPENSLATLHFDTWMTFQLYPEGMSTYNVLMKNRNFWLHYSRSPDRKLSKTTNAFGQILHPPSFIHNMWMFPTVCKETTTPSRKSMCFMLRFIENNRELCKFNTIISRTSFHK